MICMTPACATWCVNDEFVAGLAGLVPAHLHWSYFLYFTHS